MSLIIGISQGNNKQRPAEPFPVADLSPCRENPFCKRAREQTIATSSVSWPGDQALVKPTIQESRRLISIQFD